MPKILNDPKNNMLAETERLLKSGGYNAVTVRAVAQGCGVGVGTVYNYFKSKEALLAEYLLTDWRTCIAAMEQASGGPEAVAHCIYKQLSHYAESHMSIFTDEAAKGSFAGSFGQYHGMLRSQLAAPLLPFSRHTFAAEFMAEALITWTMAGKEFCEIWELLAPLIKE